MSANSKIIWTHHTFNPWWGCTKVSPACKNCYAKPIAARLGSSLFGAPIGWGAAAQRGYRMDLVEPEARAWNRKAMAKGEIHRVFCGSMCDVFEGLPEQGPYLDRLWRLIEETPNLHWLLLTKRPENILKSVPWSRAHWPNNVWTGATIENQECAEDRIPPLLEVPSAVRFVSAEPLLGPLDLSPYLGLDPGQINWLIVGGESGPGARGYSEMLQWYRSLREQSHIAEVPFFFKQWGKFAQVGEDVYKLHGKKNPDNRLDGLKWEQYPGNVNDPAVSYEPPTELTVLDRILDPNSPFEPDDDD